MNRNRPNALRSLLLPLVWLAAGAAFAGTPIDERQAASPDGSVLVSNVSGRIVVSGWDRDEIEVTGTLGRNVERLDFVRDGDHTVIEVIYPKTGNSEGSDLEIRIPSGSELEVKAVSARIDVSGVSGRQRLRSVSGNVTTEVFDADVEAETVSGDVSASGMNKPTHTSLTTVSGRIETHGVSGELDASTVSGRIETEGEMLSWARLKTTNGRITVDSGLASGGRFDLGTTNGRVKLMLDTDRNLDVDAQTFNGDIDNCFGIESSKSRYSPERTLRFQNGDADRTVRIRSMNGPIEICSKARSS